VRFGLSLGPNLPSTSNRAHQIHANPQVTQPLACSECHLVPNSAFDPGHLFDDPQRRISDLRAEVTFGPKARLGGVQPSYDPGTGTCVVYCHGVRVGEPPPTSSTVRGESQCDFCHNIANHGRGVDCSQCHQESTTRCTPGSPGCATITPEVGISFRSTRFHIDGRAPVVLTGQESCYSCHGTLQTRGAPPPDLNGSSRISDVTVGLHQIHVSDGDLRVGLPCSTCHMVPVNNNDPGHIDTGPPAEVIFDDLASGRLRDGPMAPKASWDRASGTCRNVYCHSRPHGAVGPVWSWNKKSEDGMHCASCHKGKPQYPLQYCIVCHLQAYRNGQINPDTHLNGRLDWSL
jgi:predicted CxxxxCH...CXXCH cytochrome family protein